MHVGTPIDKCVTNNEMRIRRLHDSKDNQEGGDTQDPYPPELLDNLIFRYEEPSTHSRWDKPLFTVPWVDAEPPTAAILSALTGLTRKSTTTEATLPSLTTSMASTTLSDTASVATGATATTGRTGVSRPKVRQHLSTVQAPVSDSSALYGLEKRTSAIVAAIRSFTLGHPSVDAALAQSADGIRIPVPDASEVVFIPAHVAIGGTSDELAGAGGILSLPRLQRLKRQWVGLNRAQVAQNYGPGTLSLDQVGDAFVRFLNADFAHVIE